MGFLGRLRSFFSATPSISWSALVGYDLFISYRRSDATPYALALFEALSKADFRCFLDDNDATPGKPLTDKLLRALSRSSVLLIVASPDLPHSTWVPREIEIFAKSKRDIILINIKEGISLALTDETLGPLLNKDDLWIDEQPDIGPGGAPSAYVIGSVQKNFNHRRANRNLRLIASVVTTVVAGFAALAAWQWHTALARLDVVQSQALAADARRLAPQEPLLALKTALAAFAISDSPDAETALLEGLARVPSLKRFLPCAESRAATGAAFSAAQDGLLGYACESYSGGATETTLSVVDLDGHPKYVRTIAGDAREFSFTDGLHLRLEMPGGAKILDLQTGQLRASSSPAQSLPIASQSEQQEKLNQAIGGCISQYPLSTRYFASAISAEGRFVAYTTEANQIVIADLTTGACVGRPLEAHTHNILAISWSPSGRYLASAGAIADGNNEHGVVLWDREQISIFARVVYESNRLNYANPEFALSEAGSSWICGACGDQIIWDGQTISWPRDIAPGPISSVAMKLDGKEAAFARSGSIVVIPRAADNSPVELRLGPSGSVKALTYVNDALYAEDDKLNVWNVSGSTPTKVINGPGFESLSALDDSPTGPYFISEIWDHLGASHFELAEVNKRAIKEFLVPSDAGPCASLTFSPDAMTVVRTPTLYKPFLVVRVSRGPEFQRISNPLRQSAGLQTVLRNAHLSLNGERLVASSDKSGLAIFNLAAERLIGAIPLDEVLYVALAADGNAALVEGDGKILKVDLDIASWKRKAQQIISD
jgi:WD40 repeat protein